MNGRTNHNKFTYRIFFAKEVIDVYYHYDVTVYSLLHVIKQKLKNAHIVVVVVIALVVYFYYFFLFEVKRKKIGDWSSIYFFSDGDYMQYA